MSQTLPEAPAAIPVDAALTGAIRPGTDQSLALPARAMLRQRFQQVEALRGLAGALREAVLDLPGGGDLTEAQVRDLAVDAVADSGAYAPATGILRTALAAAVQASLDRADAATTSTQLAAALTALKAELLGGADPAWDTLQELRALLTSSDAADDLALADLLAAVGAKYTKPGGGIPLADLATEVTAALSASGPQGPPGVVRRGAWDTNASYAVDDLVQHGGRAFVALTASTGVTPPASATSSASWSLLVDRGAPGPAGTGAAGIISPADLALKAWSCDPAVLNTGNRTTPVAGQMTGTLLNLPTDTITAASFFLGVTGAGVTNAFLGLIDAATGTRLAVTADISSVLTGAQGQIKRVPFTTPLAAAGGPVYVVLLVGAATTMPQFTKFPNGDTATLNIRGPGQPAGRIRTGRITNAGGLTAVPTTNDLATNEAQNTGLWVVLD